MTTPQNLKAPPSMTADEIPWYDLIDVAEIPEDGMQQDSVIRQLVSILEARYEHDPSVLVAGPTNIIYDSARRGSYVAPDCYVVFGVDTKTIKRHRKSYRIEEWGPVPSFVMEVASESTAANDLGRKRELYAQIGVPEYWRLDRSGEYYGTPLVGERLVDGEYQAIELHREDSGDVWSRSEALGVDFYYREEDGVGLFLVRDSGTGEWLNDLAGERAAREAAEARAQEAEARAEAEQAARQAAEAELDRLRRQQSNAPRDSQ
jgi:Uma2 family endonuclease